MPGLFNRKIRTNLSFALKVQFRETRLSKSRVVREKSLNGEIHFILPESKFDETKKNAENFDDAEIRKLMKKEATKPLLLLREE